MTFQPNSPQREPVLLAHKMRVALPGGTTREIVLAAYDIYDAKTAAAAECGVGYEAVTILQIEDPV